MGNNVCCDKTPFTISDIAQTRDTFSSRRIVPENLVPNRDAFSAFEHNLKVFAVAEPPSGFPTRDTTRAIPLSLGGMIVVDPTLSYVVLDVKRIASAPGRQVPACAEQAPKWAVDSFAALTPRGLGCTFGFDFGNLLLRTPPAEERFSFSIFVFKGRLASATTGAAATMVGMALERMIMYDVELLTRLFYNYNVARQAEAGQVSAVGVLDFSDPRLDRSCILRENDFATVVAKNALLRSLTNQLEAEKIAAVATPARRELLDRAASQMRSPAGGSGAPTRHTDPVPQAHLTPKVANPPPATGSVASNISSSSSSSSVPVLAKISLPTVQPICAQLLSQEADATDPEDEKEMTRDKIDRLKKFEPLVTEVLPHLFVGGEVAAKDLAQLQRCGVTHIINAAAVIVPSFYPVQFAYTNLFLCDSPDEPISALFALVIAIIEEELLKGGKVFVHCVQGVSRSCSLVIVYVMWKLGLSYDAAYRVVREQRKICSPNSGFMVSLLGFQSQLAAGDNKSYLWRFQPYSQTNLKPLVFQAVPLDQRVCLDPATCYGCIAHREGGIDVYFSAGAEITSDAVVAAAAAQFEQHVRYSFFIGPTCVKSRTYRGDEIAVQPSTAHRRRIARLSHDEMAAVLQEAASGGQPLDAGVRRDDQLRLLLPNGSLAAVCAADAARPPLEEPRQVLAEDDAPSAAVTSPPDCYNTIVQDQDLSVRDDDSEPEQGQDSVLVFKYPFRRTDDQCDVISIDDLSTDAAYAIILRGYRASNRPHLVYLWVGEDCTKSDEQIREAYESNLVATGLRITSRSALQDVPPQQCLEGQEPDELLLAFA
jgi:hypothetical protein